MVIEQGSAKSLLVTQEEISRFTHRSRPSLKGFIERTEKKIRDKESRIKEKLRVKDSEELRECTFRPKLIRRAKSSLGSRSLKQFLDDQQRYQENKKSRQVMRAEHNQTLLS